MSCIHKALEDLPTLLMDAGVNVIVAGGYLNGQCEGNDHYMFSDPDTGVGSHDEKPHGFMIHHTASSSATPPPASTSKAGAWAGVLRDGRLYPTGDGVPTIYLASAGPARVSSGYGYRPAAWDYTFKGLRAPSHAQGGDGTTALNRYSFNVEIVHPGDGSELDKGVWDAVVILGAILEKMFVMTEMSLGHDSWSQRKIDPKVSVGLPNDGVNCIIDFQDGIAEGGDMATQVFYIGANAAEWESVVWLLYMLEGGEVNVNTYSSQAQTKLPWKAGHKVTDIQAEDFDLIAAYTNANPTTRAKWDTEGIYRFGLEVASLEEQAYR